MNKKLKNNFAIFFKILLGVLYVSPILIGLLFSIQPNREIALAPVHLFTKNPTIENYINVLNVVPILKYMRNTLIVIAIVVPIQLILASLSAFTFSFYDFPGKDVIFSLFLTAMMIPGEVVIISNYSTIQSLGLYNTYFGIAAAQLVNVSMLFMFRQHMMSLPKELWEAARIDGCRDMLYFVKIVIPLSTPVISAQAITSFIGVYNDYFWPMLVTSTSERQTLQVGMAQLMTVGEKNFGNILAAAMICIAIPTIGFIFGQDYIVKGMTAGAVKN